MFSPEGVLSSTLPQDSKKAGYSELLFGPYTQTAVFPVSLGSPTQNPAITFICLLNLMTACKGRSPLVLEDVWGTRGTVSKNWLSSVGRAVNLQQLKDVNWSLFMNGYKSEVPENGTLNERGASTVNWSDVSCWCLGTDESLHLCANACVCNFVFLFSHILNLSEADDHTPLKGEKQ